MFPSNPNATESTAFETDVSKVLARLRGTFAELLAAVPDDIAKGADLHHALNIDRKLSWKVYKVASAQDPVTAGPHVPSPANMKTLFKAARKRGVPEPLIESTSRVVDDFEKLVTVHAGDRATFDSMVSALSQDENSEQADLAHRRLAFRGQKHIYGVQARTRLKTVILRPGKADPSLMDIAVIEGHVAVRRLRSGAPVHVLHSAARNDDGSYRQISRRPIDPVAGTHGMALMEEFCSKPLPRFRVVNIGNETLKGELLDTGVGNKAAITCHEGHVTFSAVPRYRNETNEIGQFLCTIHTPCEAAIVDVIVREDTCESLLAPKGRVMDEHSGRAFDHDIGAEPYLPVRPPVSYLGRGPSVLHTPDVPRYADMGRYVFERLGWDGERYDVYRCRQEYPVLPSALCVYFPLATPPEA